MAGDWASSKDHYLDGFLEKDQKYRELCEEEVLELTGIEFVPWDGKGPPSLDFHFKKDSVWSFGGFRNKSLLFVKSTFADH